VSTLGLIDSHMTWGMKSLFIMALSYWLQAVVMYFVVHEPPATLEHPVLPFYVGQLVVLALFYSLGFVAVAPV
jgi:hypothetical protein